MGVLDADRLIGLRRRPVIGGMVHRLLRYASGIEVPDSVEIGVDFQVRHHGFGIVIHPLTRIGDHVRVFQGVTVGRSDVWIPRSRSDFGGIEIGDHVWLCAGAAVIGGASPLSVGTGTVLGANAVLLRSTGDWEIWAGAPARTVGERAPISDGHDASAAGLARS